MGISINQKEYDSQEYNKKRYGIKREQLSISSGKLLEETSRKQGRNFAAISKQGDTLEISKEGKRLMLSSDQETLEEESKVSVEQSAKNMAGFDFYVTDDSKLNQEKDMQYWYAELQKQKTISEPAAEEDMNEF